jgi:hypothetical protein
MGGCQQVQLGYHIIELLLSTYDVIKTRVCGPDLGPRALSVFLVLTNESERVTSVVRPHRAQHALVRGLPKQCLGQSETL